ncbi:hypothetical protein [Blautia massiliensis (ex Liu et al. 2021)]|uniref:hypothetical protein n=1 Tax=Blautia massiliensis (ex Liu et al. 2021) TaxID=3062492 RepID=UPI003F8ADBA9
MQILLIMLIVVLLAFSVLLLALAKQSPREKQTEDKEQEEYIRDYAETVRQTGGSMKKLEHWKVIAIYLMEKTPNDLIHIGKPIEMDVQEFGWFLKYFFLRHLYRTE